MLVQSSCIVLTLLASIASASVFVGKDDASAVLRRWRRANSGFLEEMKQGNLERECIEEICDYEEAREVFEDDDKTRQFWLTYNRRDPCLNNPCHNNGTCIFMGATYECQCPEGYGGQYCETRVEELLKCLYHNGQCEHFCDGSGKSRKCFCANGYKLAADRQHCITEVAYPCGYLPPSELGLEQSVSGQTRLVGSNHCSKGECPWQVLVQLNEQSHCGGALIHPEWVVTAAHCVSGHNPENLTVTAGEHNLAVNEGTEQTLAVSMVVIHKDYNQTTGDSDIALLQLGQSLTLNRHIIPVCLPTKDLAGRELLLVRYHTVSGWGRRTTGGNEEHGTVQNVPVSPILRKFSVPIIQNVLCSQRAQLNITGNMLCAGYMEGNQQSCRGDDGSPLVTLYGSTHFLTGVVAWGRGCNSPGYYGIYTNIASFVGWAKDIIRATVEKP